MFAKRLLINCTDNLVVKFGAFNQLPESGHNEINHLILSKKKKNKKRHKRG